MLLSSKETISFLRAVGKRGENSDALDYMVMTQLMLDARGKEWESMTTCDLPETFSSACWASPSTLLLFMPTARLGGGKLNRCTTR